jgi:hypothetical protein
MPYFGAWASAIYSLQHMYLLERAVGRDPLTFSYQNTDCSLMLGHVPVHKLNALTAGWDTYGPFEPRVFCLPHSIEIL